jgi:hypothetical protein
MDDNSIIIKAELLDGDKKVIVQEVQQKFPTVPVMFFCLSLFLAPIVNISVNNFIQSNQCQNISGSK